MSETEKQIGQNQNTKAISVWTQMMSYDEMLKKVRGGAPLPKNLQRFRFTAETLPETEMEFYQEMGKRCQDGPPYCAGTYCGNAIECSGFTPDVLNRTPCQKCRMSVQIWSTAGRRAGSVCPMMKG